MRRRGRRRMRGWIYYMHLPYRDGWDERLSGNRDGTCLFRVYEIRNCCYGELILPYIYIYISVCVQYIFNPFVRSSVAVDAHKREERERDSQLYSCMPKCALWFGYCFHQAFHHCLIMTLNVHIISCYNIFIIHIY